MRTYKDKLDTIEILTLDNMPISELKEVLLLINQYDFYASRIDDYNQYNTAINNNIGISEELRKHNILSVKYYDMTIKHLRG